MHATKLLFGGCWCVYQHLPYGINMHIAPGWEPATGQEGFKDIASAEYSGSKVCRSLSVLSHETVCGMMGQGLGTMRCSQDWSSRLSITTNERLANSIFVRRQRPKFEFRASEGAVRHPLPARFPGSRGIQEEAHAPWTWELSADFVSTDFSFEKYCRRGVLEP